MGVLPGTAAVATKMCYFTQELNRLYLEGFIPKNKTIDGPF
jgi:hypothetical protein